jgi:hypothetical protein
MHRTKETQMSRNGQMYRSDKMSMSYRACMRTGAMGQASPRAPLTSHGHIEEGESMIVIGAPSLCSDTGESVI